MKTNNIRIRPDRLNAPLVECFVGRLSSAVFVVAGDIPDDIEGVVVQVERTPNTSTTPPTPRDNAAITATANADGTYTAYFAPWCFDTIAADGLKYHVIGTDSKSNPRWLGSGALVVEANPANGSTIVPPIVPPDTYVRNPVTGLYHKVRAEVDEYGNINLVVDTEGVAR